MRSLVSNRTSFSQRNRTLNKLDSAIEFLYINLNSFRSTQKSTNCVANQTKKGTSPLSFKNLLSQMCSAFITKGKLAIFGSTKLGVAVSLSSSNLQQMSVFALATNTAELRTGRMMTLNGPSPILNSGARIPVTCFKSPALGGLMGGSCKTAGSDSMRPCSLRSLQIVSRIIVIKINHLSHSIQIIMQEQTHLPTPEEQIQQKFKERLNNFYQEYFLTGLQQMAVSKFIKVHLGDKNNHKVDRIRPWLLAKINQSYIPPPSPLQKGCPDIIPGLRAKPWWGRQEFPWLKHFQDNYLKIRDQVLTLRGQKGFQPYRGPSWISERKAKDGVGNESIDSGMWNVFYLELHNMKFDVNCQKVPLIMEMIDKYIPNNYHHCFISALTTNSHIMKHYGPTNKKLRFHLPLAGVKNSRMRVGDEIRQQQQGKAYVFDDSFEHQAWHDGNETRIILIVDFWHPDLSKQEIKLLNVLQNARFRAQAALSEIDPDKDNFYSIIENAKDLIQDNQWWVVDSKQTENPSAK